MVSPAPNTGKSFFVDNSLLTKSTKFAIFLNIMVLKSEQHSRFSPEVGQMWVQI
jgi:hypothetical protein